MKLSEALIKLKNLKSEVSRVDKCVDSAMTHYEDEEPEYVYLEELQTKKDLQSQIDSLKISIQLTNARTFVKSSSMTKSTLASVIIENSSLRAELAFLQKLLDHKIEYGGRYSMETRTKDTIKLQYAKGYDKKDIRTRIKAVENAKEILEGKMNQANANTELVT